MISATNRTRLEKVVLFLAIILLTGIAIKVICWHRVPIFSRDSAFYLQIIQKWHDAGHFSAITDGNNFFYAPPLSLYLTYLLMKTGLSAPHAGLALNIFFGSMIPLIVFGIAFEITHSFHFAVIAAILTLLNPFLNRLSIEIQRDVGYMFFLGLALWVLCRGSGRKEWFCWVLLGVFTGCALLIRFETLEIFFIIVLCCVISALKKVCSWKRAIGQLLLFIVSFVICMTLFSTLMDTNLFIMEKYPDFLLRKYHKILD